MSSFQTPADLVPNALKVAIENGYRHIDCAYFYDNEGPIGEALEKILKDGLVKREELFIVSKVS